MIGKTLESVPRFPWGAVFWSAVAGTMLIVASYMGNRHLALAAVAPICITAGCCLARPRRFRARVTDMGLELESPRGMLAYSDIDMINVEGRSPSHSRARIRLHHQRGVLELPANLDAPRDELHAFLLEQLDRGREARVPQALAGFLADQQATFGSDRVWAYTARAVIGPPRSNRTIRAFLVSLAVAGVLWVAAGALLREPGWVTAGLITALVCGLFSLATFAERSPRAGIKNWRQAGLVIGPVGIALSQGDVHGQLRWIELRHVSIKKTGSFRFSSESSFAHLRLKVEGAEIKIADIYNAPLATIEEQIRRYWRGPA